MFKRITRPGYIWTERVEIVETRQGIFCGSGSDSGDKECSARKQHCPRNSPGKLPGVFRGNRHFLDSESQVSCLYKHFLIKDELIGIQGKRNLFQHSAAVRAAAVVIFAQA